jgi:HSP20 family protein
MNLTRWDPLSGTEDFFNRLPSLFGRWPRQALATNGEAKYEWAPSADISETESEFRIRAELPAVKKEDIKVTVDAGGITIEGQRKERTEDKNEKFHRIESFRGSFSRSFSLPDNVNTDAIHCENKDGMLIVHIPKLKAAAPQSKQIKID